MSDHEIDDPHASVYASTDAIDGDLETFRDRIDDFMADLGMSDAPFGVVRATIHHVDEDGDKVSDSDDATGYEARFKLPEPTDELIDELVEGSQRTAEEMARGS